MLRWAAGEAEAFAETTSFPIQFIESDLYGTAPTLAVPVYRPHVAGPPSGSPS